MASVVRRFKRNAHQVRTGSRGVSNAEVAQALLNQSGHVFKAAVELKVSLATVYRRINESKELLVLKHKLHLDAAKARLEYT
jgi:hypothetical protein